MFQFIRNSKGNSVVEIIIFMSIIPLVLYMGYLMVTSTMPTDPNEETNTEITTKAEAEKIAEEEQAEVDALLADMNGVIVTLLYVLGGMLVLAVIFILIEKLLEHIEYEEESKDMFHLMKDIRKKGVSHYFVLEQKEMNKVTYQYEKNSYLFSITQTNGTIICKITKGKNSRSLLYLVYQEATRTFTAKNIAQGQIKDEKKEVPIIEGFIEQIITHDWTTSIGLNIIQEEKLEQTFEAFDGLEKENETDEAPSILQTQMHTLLAQIKTYGEVQLTERLQSLAQVLEELEPYLKTMDVEVNHIIHESLMLDVQKLIQLYADLDASEKQAYLTQVTSGMEKIENKLESVLEKAKDKKERDIAKMLLVIEKRYEEKQV